MQVRQILNIPFGENIRSYRMALETELSVLERFKRITDLLKDNKVYSEFNEQLSRWFNYQPKIGLMGKTGAGKSSLCNALFGQDICKISDVQACTREPQEILLSMGNNGLTLVDIPGVGESSERDVEYAALYQKLLPELDLIVWVLKADERAYGADQAIWNSLIKPHVAQGKPIIFALNQIEKIEPSKEWDEKKRQPGDNQKRNIDQKIDAVAATFGIGHGSIIPVSAHEKCNLKQLVDEIINVLPNERKITFARRVEKENLSEEGEQNANIGILQAAFEWIKERAAEAAEWVGEKIIDWWETIKPNWWPF